MNYESKYNGYFDFYPPKIPNQSDFISTPPFYPDQNVFSYTPGLSPSHSYFERDPKLPFTPVPGLATTPPCYNGDSVRMEGEWNGRNGAKSSNSGHGERRKFRGNSHALWVGNLPVGVTETMMKEYFVGCGEIESIALLPDSRCCFLNFPTKESVELAIKLYHNKVFHGCLIVCRVKKNKNEEVAKSNSTSESLVKASYEERYFILKSMTVDDLNLAKTRCIWSTQPKNEPILDRAFYNTKNVNISLYTPNRSGEFYGVARMESPCKNHESSEALWNSTNDYQINSEVANVPAWGNTFKIKWIHTNPVSFEKCKHLFNSWNGLKPVKISRDGTEVEPAIAKRLIQEFKNASNSSTLSTSSCFSSLAWLPSSGSSQTPPATRPNSAVTTPVRQGTVENLNAGSGGNGSCGSGKAVGRRPGDDITGFQTFYDDGWSVTYPIRATNTERVQFGLDPSATAYTPYTPSNSSTGSRY
ncbi:hypothetical protein HK098_001990 [Nowakowskiella sp. JEL0407]|nr:hypothetical protein HK098_001990 [Nowakowskiella sp. JEL0407]